MPGVPQRGRPVVGVGSRTRSCPDLCLEGLGGRGRGHHRWRPAERADGSGQGGEPLGNRQPGQQPHVRGHPAQTHKGDPHPAMGGGRHDVGHRLDRPDTAEAEPTEVDHDGVRVAYDGLKDGDEAVLGREVGLARERDDLQPVRSAGRDEKLWLAGGQFHHVRTPLGTRTIRRCRSPGQRNHATRLRRERKSVLPA